MKTYQDTISLALIEGQLKQYPLEQGMLRSMQHLQEQGIPAGLLQPVVLIKVNALFETYTIGAGRRRLRCATELGLDTVPAFVLVPEPTDDADAIASQVALIENQARSPNPVTDVGAIRHLAQLNWTEDQIMAATGLDKLTYERCRRLLLLLPEFYEAFTFGNLAFGTAEKLAKHSKEQQRALLKLFKQNGDRITQREIADYDREERESVVAEIASDLFAEYDEEEYEEWRIVADQLFAELMKAVPPGTLPDYIAEKLAEVSK